MVTVLFDQVELHPSQFSLAKAIGKDVEDTPECEVPVTNWVPYSTQLQTNSFYRFFAQTCPDVCCFTIWFFFVKKVFLQTPESKLFSRCSITNLVNAKLKSMLSRIFLLWKVCNVAHRGHFVISKCAKKYFLLPVVTSRMIMTCHQ